MLTTLIASTLVLAQAAPAPDLTGPELSLQQRTSLRCAAAFALVAEGQANGNEAAKAYPAMGQRGKEFFVRASAQVMEETGLSRAQIGALLSQEAQSLWDNDTLTDVMPGCLLLLDASGV